MALNDPRLRSQLIRNASSSNSDQSKGPPKNLFETYGIGRQQQKEAAASNTSATFVPPTAPMPSPIASSITKEALMTANAPTKTNWMPSFATSTPIPGSFVPKKVQQPRMAPLFLNKQSTSNQQTAEVPGYVQDLRHFVRSPDNGNGNDGLEHDFLALLEDSTNSLNSSQLPKGQRIYADIINKESGSQQNVSISSNSNITIEENLAKTELNEEGEKQRCLLTIPAFHSIMIELAKKRFNGWILHKSKNDPKGKYYFVNVKKPGETQTSWLAPDDWIDEIKKRIPDKAQHLEEHLLEDSEYEDGSGSDEEGEMMENANEEQGKNEMENPSHQNQLQVEPPVQSNEEAVISPPMSSTSSLPNEPLQPDAGDNSSANEHSILQPFNGTEDALGLLFGNQQIVVEREEIENRQNAANDQPAQLDLEDGNDEMRKYIENFDDNLGSFSGIVRDIRSYEQQNEHRELGNGQMSGENFSALDVPVDVENLYDEEEQIHCENAPAVNVVENFVPKPNNSQIVNVEVATEMDAQNAAKTAQLLVNIFPEQINLSLNENLRKQSTAKKTVNVNVYGKMVAATKPKKNRPPLMRFDRMDQIRVHLPAVDKIINQIKSTNPGKFFAAQKEYLQQVEKKPRRRIVSSSDENEDEEKDANVAEQTNGNEKIRTEIKEQPVGEHHRMAAIRSGRRSSAAQIPVIKLDDDEEFYCHICPDTSTSFNSRNDYRLHMLFRHKTIVADSENIIDYLKRQQLSIISSLDFYCETCGKAFDSSRQPTIDKANEWAAHIFGTHLDEEEQQNGLENNTVKILHTMVEGMINGQNPFHNFKKERLGRSEMKEEALDHSYIPGKKRASGGGKKKKGTPGRRNIKKEEVSIDSDGEEEFGQRVQKTTNENEAPHLHSQQQQNNASNFDGHWQTISNPNNSVVIIGNSTIDLDSDDDDENEYFFGKRPSKKRPNNDENVQNGRGIKKKKMMGGNAVAIHQQWVHNGNANDNGFDPEQPSTSAASANTSTSNAMNCQYCGASFSSAPAYEMHISSSHYEQHFEQIIAKSTKQTRGPY